MFLTEIGKCDFLTEMYYYKNNKSRSLCQETQTKKSPKFLWNSFAVRTGLEPVTPCVTGRYSNQLN